MVIKVKVFSRCGNAMSVLQFTNKLSCKLCGTARLRAPKDDDIRRLSQISYRRGQSMSSKVTYSFIQFSVYVASFFAYLAFLTEQPTLALRRGE